MDPKSQPPLPDQPAPQGGPPTPGPATAGAPPEWDAMPPAALAPAPASEKSSRRGKLVVIVIVAAAIVIASFVVVATLRSPAGNVYFSRTAYDTSNGTCQFDSPVTTVSTSDRVYLIAAFNDAMQAQDNYTLEILKDGASIGRPATKTADAKFNCYVEQSSLGPLSAGVYRFTFKHNDKIEAEGTLVVK
jgi:hypothetical protein